MKVALDTIESDITKMMTTIKTTTTTMIIMIIIKARTIKRRGRHSKWIINGHFILKQSSSEIYTHQVLATMKQLLNIKQYFTYPFPPKKNVYKIFLKKGVKQRKREK